MDDYQNHRHLEVAEETLLMDMVVDMEVTC